MGVESLKIIQLIVVRHAVAEDVSQHFTETTRPLTEAGRRQANGLGALFRFCEFEINDLWCSPYARAKETAKLAFPENLWRGAETIGDLQPEGDAHSLAKRVLEKARDGRSLAIVSHQPLIGRFFSVLLGRPDETLEIVPAACAVLRARVKPNEPIHYLISGFLQPDLQQKLCRNISK